MALSTCPHTIYSGVICLSSCVGWVPLTINISSLLPDALRLLSSLVFNHFSDNRLPFLHLRL